jgi:hypothetical protein
MKSARDPFDATQIVHKPPKIRLSVVLIVAVTIIAIGYPAVNRWSSSKHQAKPGTGAHHGATVLGTRPECDS